MNQENADATVDSPIPAVIPIELAEGYRAWYSTRLGGNSDATYGYANMSSRQGDDEWAVSCNREALDGVIGSHVYTVYQVHSGEVVLMDEIEDKTKMTELEADGIVSTSDEAFGVFGADCLPVLLVDPHARVSGVAHCGRRGLMNGIIEQTVAAMEFKGAHREHIRATLGPCICGQCYEVGNDIAMAFEEKFPGTATITQFGGAGIDLEKAALQALKKADVLQDNLVDSLPRVAAATEYLTPDPELRELCENDEEGSSSVEERMNLMHNALCTRENPLWFSYRRATLAGKDVSGRMLACVSPYKSE
ncbi:polyphenol oxidase family protein [Alloscardovia venturai]|uniref:Polyphenol oxidase family protein n=1 Tax=Alloscardovia venturai TaxID=1769421 RepID=A0ABW2Y3J7_9BIFI